MSLREPYNLDLFMKPPTQEEWEAELADGWLGSDGSTISSDAIFGVRIGVESDWYQFSRLPANLHDYRYRVSRRLGGLPETWRRAADRAYRDGCEDLVVSGLRGWRVLLKPIAIWRCQKRYEALRIGGYRAWTKPPRSANGE